MITNLLATVIITVITNVTETPTDFARYDPCPCPDKNEGCLVIHYKGSEPQAKHVTTRVVERTTLAFDWAGQRREVITERELYSQTVQWRKEWFIETIGRPHFESHGTNFLNWVTGITNSTR